MCPDGWIYLKSSCYYFSQTIVNQSNALSSCQDMGADLVVPLSEEETRMIKGAAKRRNYWIGLKLDSKTSKFYTTSGLPPTFTKWIVGKPDNSLNKGCVLFKAKREDQVGGWENKACSILRRYICKQEC